MHEVLSSTLVLGGDFKGLVLIELKTSMLTKMNWAREIEILFLHTLRLELDSRVKVKLGISSSLVLGSLGGNARLKHVRRTCGLQRGVVEFVILQFSLPIDLSRNRDTSR